MTRSTINTAQLNAEINSLQSSGRHSQAIKDNCHCYRTPLRKKNTSSFKGEKIRKSDKRIKGSYCARPYAPLRSKFVFLLHKNLFCAAEKNLLFTPVGRKKDFKTSLWKH